MDLIIIGVGSVVMIVTLMALYTGTITIMVNVMKVLMVKVVIITL